MRHRAPTQNTTRRIRDAASTPTRRQKQQQRLLQQREQPMPLQVLRDRMRLTEANKPGSKRTRKRLQTQSNQQQTEQQRLQSQLNQQQQVYRQKAQTE